MSGVVGSVGGHVQRVLGTCTGGTRVLYRDPLCGQTNRMTDAAENITFATLFAEGSKTNDVCDLKSNLLVPTDI